MEQTEYWSYERSLNHTYLVYSGRAIENDYEIQMLLNNRITGVLPCQLKKVDGKNMLYYEITSKHSLKQMYEKKKMNHAALKALFTDMRQTIAKMEEFLLSPELFVMDANMIFANLENSQFYFCLLPKSENSSYSLHSFLEYILECVDYSDERAVAAAYDWYKKSGEDNYSFEQIYEDIFGNSAGQEFQKIVKPDLQEPSQTARNIDVQPIKKLEEQKKLEPQQGIHDYGEDHLDKETSVHKKWKLSKSAAGTAVILAALIVGLAVMIYMNIYQDIAKKVLIAVVAFLAAGIYIYHKKEEKDLFEEDDEDEDEWQEGWQEIGTSVSGDSLYERKQTDTEPAYDSSTEQEISYGETVFMENVQIDRHRKLKPVSSAFPAFTIVCFPFILGKLEGAVDGKINHETVSRIHCKLEFEEGEYYITDLNSKNGTVIEGNLLNTNEKTVLHIGDEIRLGEAVYIFD